MEQLSLAETGSMPDQEEEEDALFRKCSGTHMMSHPAYKSRTISLLNHVSGKKEEKKAPIEDRYKCVQKRNYPEAAETVSQARAQLTHLMFYQLDQNTIQVQLGMALASCSFVSSAFI